SCAALSTASRSAPDRWRVLQRLDSHSESRWRDACGYARNPPQVCNRHCQFRHPGEDRYGADGAQDRGDVHAICPHRRQARAGGRRVGGEPAQSDHWRQAIACGGDSMSRRRVANPSPAAPKALLGDIRALIEASRQRAASTVNAELTLLFWRIGQRIHTEVLAGQRAGYGEEILPTLAAQLSQEYGRGFGEKNLRRMVKFAVTFPDEPIVATLSRQLSWSHFV